LDDLLAARSLAPLDCLIADTLEFVDRNEIPDLPGRIVLATCSAGAISQ
jgi:hypothetical protein